MNIDSVEINTNLMAEIRRFARFISPDNEEKEEGGRKAGPGSLKRAIFIMSLF